MVAVNVQGFGIVHFDDDVTTEFVKRSLRKKFKEVGEFVKDAYEGLSPLDQAALLTAPVPIIGDVTGLASDITTLIKDPESRTIVNGLFAAAGALPFVPSGLGAARKVLNADKVKDLAKGSEDGISSALDMSESARLARAKDQGFDVDEVFLHGSNQSFADEIGADYVSPVAESFDVDRIGESASSTVVRPQKASYFTTSQPHAELYGSEIFQARLNKSDLKQVDILPEIGKVYEQFGSGESIEDFVSSYDQGAFGAIDADHFFDQELIAAKKDGFKGVIFKFGDFTLDGVTPIGDVALISDPAQIRSVNAAFDPAKKTSGNLLAGGVAGAVGLGALNQEDDEPADDEL